MTVRDKQTTTTTTVIRPQKHLFSYFRTFCVLAYYRRGPERNEKVKSEGKKTLFMGHTLWQMEKYVPNS